MSNAIRTCGLAIVCFVFLFVVVYHAKANTAPNAPSIVGPGEGSPGAEYGFNISANDPDSDQVRYLVDWESDGIVDYESELFDSGTIKLVTHAFVPAGIFTIEATAQDAFGAQSSSTIFSVTVSEVNNLPVLSPVGDQTIFENQEASFGVSATDLDGDTLSYSILDIPSGATYTQKTFEERIFYLFEWTPSGEQSGVYQVVFMVDDGEGGSDSELITITVENVESTKDTATPIIGTVEVSKATESSIVILWTTNEKTVGKVEYGKLNAFDKSSGFTGTYATSSESALSGLDAGAQYQYRLIVKDESGNEARSVDKSFTTISSEAVAEADLRFRIASSQLARVEGDTRVYYITKRGFKKWIRNEEIFYSYQSNEWEDVVVVSPGDLDIYPEVDLIRHRGDYKVYKMEGDTKRWIKTAEVFANLGYDWNDILSINDIEFNFYKEGSPIE